MTPIVITGYTAAGKTTHSRLLAEALGYHHVWAAALLLDRLGYEDVRSRESELWFGQSEAIELRRAKSDVDAWVDNELLRLAVKGNVVLDSRFLPWLRGVECLNIWLESDFRSRANKCLRSVPSIEPHPTLAQCAVHVHEKDGRDVSRVASNYSGIFAADPQKHQLIIDISDFAYPSSSGPESLDLIAKAQTYIQAAVAWHFGDPAPAAQLATAHPKDAWGVYHQMPGLWSDLNAIGVPHIPEGKLLR